MTTRTRPRGARHRAHRAGVRVTLACLLVGTAWWLGRALGQHRRAARQMGVTR